MNYSIMIFTMFLALVAALIFAIWSDNNNNFYVYAQQSYLPLIAAPSKLANSTGNRSNEPSKMIPKKSFDRIEVIKDSTKRL